MGDRFTAFTGAFLRALDDPDPRTLDQIFVTVDRDLVARNLPRPQRRAINTAGNLALSRGPTTRPDTEPPDADAVCLTRTYRWLTAPAFGAVFYVLCFYFLTLILTLILSWFLAHVIATFFFSEKNLLWVFVFNVFVLPLIPVAVNIARPRASRLGRAVFVLKNSASGETDVRVHELIIDRSGLTIRRTPATTHLPWRDIAQVGILQPERGALNCRLPLGQYTRTDLLVVRLRPEVPGLRGLSVLSDEHRQLGYLGLCTVEELGSSRQEMTSALERFAGGKLVHSSRQFLDRDPRLRPEMV
ncbi:MAG: hypothetical protein ACRDRI_08350 [Pseudonocardiaceae bacterium]